MKKYIAVQQFEIRFSHIIDFARINKELIAPYVLLASELNISNEGLIKERIVLDFQQERYTIAVLADRLVIKFDWVENEEYLTNNNGPIESVYFGLFQKFSELSTFGKVKNYLLDTVFVDISGESKEDVFKKMSNIIDPKYSSLLPSYTDVGYLFDRISNDGEINIEFGPYLGIEDLKKRNINPLNEQSDVLSKFGYFYRVKKISLLNKPTFSDYKKAFRELINIKEKIANL